MKAPLIEVDRLVKRYGAVTAVNDVSFDIRAGEFFALLGPSGCGKTSLMRLIAGFETPDAGAVRIDGRDISHDPPHRRPVNMMFQSYALFPHMSVASNIAFGLRRQGLPSGEIKQRVSDMLRLVRLDELGARRPDQLSGGQKARVALARALACRPRLLLLDEPLSALDRKLREDMQFELMQVQRDLGVAFLVVTHDQDEAMAMAQRIGVMREGVIEQIGAPRDIYDEPASAWIADFIGDANLIEGRIVESDLEGSKRRTIVEAGDSRFAVREPAAADRAHQAGAAARIAVRAERIALALERPQADNVIEGEIADFAYRGGAIMWRVAYGDSLSLRVAQASANGGGFMRGDRVFASWPAEAARVLTR